MVSDVDDLLSPARLGQGRDANWPEWYAAYMVAEQAGTELPS
jgi:hypothetical protein